MMPFFSACGACIVQIAGMGRKRTREMSQRKKLMNLTKKTRKGEKDNRNKTR